MTAEGGDLADARPHTRQAARTCGCACRRPQCYLESCLLALQALPYAKEKKKKVTASVLETDENTNKERKVKNALAKTGATSTSVQLAE